MILMIVIDILITFIQNRQVLLVTIIDPDGTQISLVGARLMGGPFRWVGIG